jgi:DNA (cytosine-5)-methyltransferase 1
MLTHLSLFPGIGGIDLAAEWAGFETVGQVEWADYPTKVLEKHWPTVPRWRDIREVTYDKFRDRTGLETVDLISGGFPCQPFSVAGKQKGKGDDRYLWPEMCRVIREIKPTYVLGENVPGILRIAGKTVCEDLEREGYAVTVFNFEAAAVGAKHRRDRVFFIGHYTHTISNAERGAYRENVRESIKKWKDKNIDERYKMGRNTRNICQDVADTESKRWTLRNRERKPGRSRFEYSGQEDRCNAWAVEPNVGRVAHGIPSRVDRLKCLGNAVVPQQVFPILQAIAAIDGEGLE